MGVVWSLALLGPAVTWFGGAALISASQSDTVGPEECEGLGFGCTLSDRDGLWFLALVFGVPVVTVVTALTAIAAALVTARHRRGPTVELVLLAVVVVGVLVVSGRI